MFPPTSIFMGIDGPHKIGGQNLLMISSLVTVTSKRKRMWGEVKRDYHLMENGKVLSHQQLSKESLSLSSDASFAPPRARTLFVIIGKNSEL